MDVITSDQELITHGPEKILGQSLTYFYFPIENGIISGLKTNPPNVHHVEKLNNFDIMFKTSSLVNIQVKLIAENHITAWLFQSPDIMLDCQTGPCINLNWVGYVNYNDKFILSGPIDDHVNGYWYINIL